MLRTTRRAASQLRWLSSVSRGNLTSAAESSFSARKAKEAATEKGADLQRKATKSSLDVLKGISLPAEAHSQRVAIDAIGPTSFTVNGVRVYGSLLLLPHLATFWNVNTLADISDDAFALVKLHTPRPDMLLLGTGASVQPVSPAIYKYFRSLGVRFDVLDTKNACQTFNVLNEEGRLVAVALLPEATRPSTPMRARQ